MGAPRLLDPAVRPGYTVRTEPSSEGAAPAAMDLIRVYREEDTYKVQGTPPLLTAYVHYADK